ncbi:MAG: protein-L-isoaspartate O-methyltransferase [Nitrosomonadaceae bacterium]|nr:protein-L-isoaspartate O-methyltransferase [Nitrosomonadaceae bacterium]|tara:strand:+ start:74 stop:727 length:654 start_codon:yes stop_codon:yes gene_type:complete
MNLEQTRFNMVEQQIRPWDVLDPEVIKLLFEMRREEFVPTPYRSLAFVDMEIPLGYGEVMLAPKMEARIVQELQVKKTDKILEIGSGSGYLTSLLAKKGGYVYSIEVQSELKMIAEKNLQAHNITNVTLDVGDVFHGCPENGPYDVIVFTGSVPVLPEEFQKNLVVGGRLFAVEGEEPIMHASLITCVKEGIYSRTGLFETCIAKLRNVQQKNQFIF